MFCIKFEFCNVFSYSLFKGSVIPLCTVLRKKLYKRLPNCRIFVLKLCTMNIYLRISLSSL